MLTLLETKRYLRVDYPDEDALITGLISTAESLCEDTLRKELTDTPLNRTACLYAVAYLFEHREDADMRELSRSLRYILMTDREAAF